SCDENVAALNGGKIGSPCPTSGCVSCASGSAITKTHLGTAPSARRSRGRQLPVSDGEDQQQRHHEGEDAQRFGHGEAEQQVGELARGRRRIAQRARQELAEQVADADGRRTRADGSETAADELRKLDGGDRIHCYSSYCERDKLARDRATEDQ